MVDVNQAPVRASFREGFAFAAISAGVGGVIGVASSILIARLYGIEVVGQYALATAPMGIVWFFSTVRERPGLIRALNPLQPRAPEITGIFAAVLAFSVALTALMSIVGAGITYLLFNGPIDQPDLFVPAVVCLGGYLIVINTGWNLDGAFSAFRAGRQLFWVRLHQAVAFMLLAAAAHAIAETVWCLIFALLGAALTSLIHRIVAVRLWMRIIVPTRVLKAGFRTLPDILRFGLRVTPGSLADGASAEAGTWILGSFSSVASVGAWNIAWTMGKRTLDLNMRLAEMLFPTLVQRWAADDRLGFQRALTDSTRYVVTTMLLPAAVAGGAADGVMGLFGPGFSQASGALVLLLLVPALATTIIFQSQALLAVDRPTLTSVLSVVRFMVTLSASVALTITIGITGTAIAVVLGFAVQLAAQLRFVTGHFETSIFRYWPHRQMIALVPAYVAGFAIARILDAAIVQPAGLFAALIAGSAAYAAAVIMVGGLLPRDREVGRSIARRILPVRALKVLSHGAERRLGGIG
ncbi:MAG: lipopolysaccharide biosynthesis protein [Solirubrobacterales bacterium]